MKKSRFLSLLALLCCLLVILPTQGHAQAPQYTVTVLGTPTANGIVYSMGTWAYGINSSGQISGWAEGYSANVAVRWTGASPEILGNLGSVDCYGYGINDAGQVSGQIWNNIDKTYHAVRWTGTAAEDLGSMVGSNLNINASGQIVGQISTTGGASEGVVWTGTTPNALGIPSGIGSAVATPYSINASGQVSGSASALYSGLVYPVRWTGTSPQILGFLGSVHVSAAYAINNSGQATGYCYPSSVGSYHAVVWNGTTPTDLGTLYGTATNDSSVGYGINGYGDVVGMSSNGSGGSNAAFLYMDGTMYNLQDLLVPGSGVSGLHVGSNGNCINDSDQIVAGTGASYSIALLLTPVPVIPTATTMAATPVTYTSATLNGSVNPGFGSTAVSFDYGLTTAYGTNVPGTPTSLNGRFATPVSVNLTGLALGTTYHFRVNGANAAGTANGSDLTFTTPTSASSQIVNVDATQYGDFKVGLPSLNVSLPAGNYLLTPVNPQTDSRALYTAWDPYTGFDDWNSIVEIGLGSTGQQISSMGIFSEASTPAQAFAAANNVPIIVTLAAADSLLFGVVDRVLSDNQGGVSLTIQPITAPQAWRWTFFNTASNTGNSADAANPYNTGIPNLAVFAFMGPNQNPATAQFTQLPQLQVSNGNYVYSFTQPAGVSGVTYGAQYTTSLAPTNWQPITDTGSGTQHIFSVPIGSNAQMFVRLTVTEQ